MDIKRKGNLKSAVTDIMLFTVILVLVLSL